MFVIHFKKTFLLIIGAILLLTNFLVVKPAAAISSTGGGSSVVNGRGDFVALDPFIISSNVLGDINSTQGINISISANTTAVLQFSTTINSVTADPSSNLNLGAGFGAKVWITPTANEIIIPVKTLSAPANSYVTISGVKIHATAHGTALSYKGQERIEAITAGGTIYGTYFDVDAQDPLISNSNISVVGNSGSLVNTFIKNDIATVCWDNAVAGDNNNDINKVSIDFTEFGGAKVLATNIADVWCANYKLPDGLIISGVKAKVIATDLVGNVISENTSFFNIDTQAPIIVITKTPNVDLSNDSYQISINFGDAMVHMEYQLDGGSFVSYSGIFTVSLNGHHVINVRGTDAVGNIGMASASFTIDNVAPVAPVVAVSWQNSQIIVSWNNVETGASYEVYRNEILIASTSSLMFIDDNLTRGQNYTYYVVATDVAGNQSLPSNSVTIYLPNPQISSISFESAPSVTMSLQVSSSPQVSMSPQVSSLTPEVQAKTPAGIVQAATTNANQVTTNWALIIAIILAGLLILGGGLYWWYSREEDEI
jgi:fibronectin type 3 domain-containing protein